MIDYKDYKSSNEFKNALTAVGWLLRHALYIVIGLLLIAVASIDLERIIL